MTSNLPSDHPSVRHGRIGVLLLNLGTPDGTDYFAVRRYLKEFLSDPRVIDAPRWLWWPVLNLAILSFRPQRSGKNYDKIWDREANDSPLRVISARQAERLQERLSGDDRVLVDYAMRYGNPSTRDRLELLQQRGCERILLMPLYPQYSATTTATANDKAFEALKSMRWQPAVRTLPSYHADPAYISAVAQSIRDHLATLDFEPEVLFASYHGMPKSYLEKGDPYYCFCQMTSRLVAAELGWPDGRLVTTFQSRFGRAEWLQPYTEPELEARARAGLRRVAVVTPGFSVDCIETLEEIAIGAEETFKAAGGTHFSYIPCLNDSPGGMEMIEKLVRRELEGWL